MRAPLLRRASVALVALTVACGDSTGPNLSEEQVFDMLDAMSAVANFSEIPGSPAAVSSLKALKAAPTFANATVSVNQTVSCENGGSATVSGTATDNEQTPVNTVTATVTHSFSACSAASTEGRVWTFNGAPNIVTSLSATTNESTGAYSMTVTQVGGVRYASNLGEGTCQINLSFTLNGNANSLSSSISGSACGRSISQTIEITN